VSRGWSSVGLKTVGDDENLWTVTDAANLLGPPKLSPGQVRQLISMMSLEPVGKRRVTVLGRSGRHARVYRAIELIKAYDALSRVL
jgi:hypothetical protein